MATPAKDTVSADRWISDGGGAPLPIYPHTGVRVNATATAASTTAAAVPSGATVIEVRATDAIWIRFGLASVGAAAADNNSILWTPGSGPIWLPEVDNQTSTHFRCMRVGAADVPVQLEAIA